jgi:hypothetical protein
MQQLLVSPHPYLIGKLHYHAACCCEIVRLSFKGPSHKIILKFTLKGVKD